MIDRHVLLSDLQSVLRKLEADLRERTSSVEVPEVGEWLRAEYQKAKDAERTAHTYQQWLDDFITQVAAAWVLSCVFARFLEDNQLIDPPRIAGPGKRLAQARDEHTLFFQDPERAKLTDREYLLDLFEVLAQLPAGKDLFGPHNPMNALPNWLGPDAAGELLSFFQKIDSDTGALLHDFTDAEWDTRFLGDLYQDLSEAARKKYALLQTPDFVEEFILDRTLDPALDEFGLEAPPIKGRDSKELTNAGFRMIDPACGSGHFLLGTFPRILDRWQKQEPGTNVRDLVQRTLNAIHGVDINPFAIAIARFRLLLAALKACHVTQLSDAPEFQFHLACGDSLYHGRQRQKMLDDDWTDESHYFGTEDAEELRSILEEGTFHAVVANPPYITPKDRAANQAYRKLYPNSCHMKYALSVPFMERIFGLAIDSNSTCGGYTGQITSNSFMKREFGKKLIESFIPLVDLTHVIDTSGVYIPGHGTPTTILFGRNQKPITKSLRTVMGIRGEPRAPEIPAQGFVWTAIIKQIDVLGSKSEFISVNDSEREQFAKHPWTIGGGGLTELKERLEKVCETMLDDYTDSIGITCFTLEDDIYILPHSAACRSRINSNEIREMVVGDALKDWMQNPCESSVFPYDTDLIPVDDNPNHMSLRYLWVARTCLANNKMFGGKTKVECGLRWYEYGRLTREKLTTQFSIAFAFVSTHNHFVLISGSKIFKNSAPVIKLSREATENEHLAILGLLNSSTACFWIRMSAADKGMSGGVVEEQFERFFMLNSTTLGKYPIVKKYEKTICRSQLLNNLGQHFQDSSPDNIFSKSNNYLIKDETSEFHKLTALKESLFNGNAEFTKTIKEMIRVQEDLDWECYRLYDLLEDDLTYPGESLGIQLGERAFEIVLARKMAAGEVDTTWFERHGSTPITEIPDHWPDDYKQLVQRRIEVIEENKNIALIEQPEYKRRWNTEPWDSQVERALKSWLLDRLESYFDFDGRMNEAGKPTAQIEIGLTSVAKLADIARQDEQFMEVAEVYRDDPAFDVQRLIEDLVKVEHVPLLPVLRYKPSGLRNRAAWEQTWELQRLEDRLRAAETVNLTDYDLTDKQRTELTAWQTEMPDKQKADDRGLDQILSIPVPPKYKSSDFISTGGARYWSLRGKLDVPKERWVSFPYCESADGTLMIAWAGYNHLQLAQAIGAYFVEVQEHLGGRDDPRLIPLLACVIELLPWLKQWHHELDSEYNQRMDEVYAGFVTEEAKGLGLTIDEIKAWQPPKKTTKRTRTKST